MTTANTDTEARPSTTAAEDTVVRRCPVCHKLASVTDGVVRPHRDGARRRCVMGGRTAPTALWAYEL